MNIFVKMTFVCALMMVILSGWAVAQQPMEVHSIGEQQWASRNLDVITFRNGDSIPEVRSEKEWKRAAKAGRPAWCYYENNQENGTHYGKLYNWFAVNDPRGLAPEGWHIPSQPEIHEVVKYLDNHYGKVEEVDSLFEAGRIHTNEDSFHAFQGGFRLTNGSFHDSGKYGFWWGTTCYMSTHSWLKHMRTGSGFKAFNLFYHGDGYSVRCIKDQ